MARIREIFVLCVLVSVVVCDDAQNSEEDDLDSCEKFCKSTYPVHTYPEPDNLCSCYRGCRLFTIIDMIEEYSDVNATINSCADACSDAYDITENKESCELGCKNGESFTLPLQKFEEVNFFRPDPFDMNFMYPFLYMHNMYSNMIDKISQSVVVSWSYYSQGDDGQMFVMKSEPKLIMFSGSPDYKTQNYVETNIAAVDNSATPNVKASQVFDSSRLNARDLELDAKDYYEDVPQDWLSCISRKTGISKLLLCLTIFLSILGMIWLCLSTTANPQESRITVEPQRLSFFGDLEYLKTLDEKGLLKKCAPQGDCVQAPPLPIKIKVQTL